MSSLAHGQTQIPNTDEYILIHEQLIEISTNEELIPLFELGYHKFWLQSQIPILYHALKVIVHNFLVCFPVFLFGRTKIQWRYEPHHKKQHNNKNKIK